MVWANGTQNSGLLKFCPGLNLVYFTLYTDQFHLPKKDREGLKLVSEMALKKWNTNFRSIQPKSKMSGLNFRQLLVANGTAFSQISIGGALSIEPKLSKIWKQRQMTQKFPGKVSRNSESY